MVRNCKLYWSVVFLTLVVFALGCMPRADTGFVYKEDNKQFSYAEDIITKQFKSSDEFKSFLKYHQNRLYTTHWLIPTGTVRVMGASEEGDALKAGSTADIEFSPTNNQVIGVDEADILKSDGNYIYTISYNKVFIIKAYPGSDAEIVATIDYKDNKPMGIFVNKNRLAVFGNFYNVEFFKKINFKPIQGMTFFDVYDISDKSNPKLKSKYKFEGNYFNARMKDNYVYLIVRSQPYYRPEFPTPIIVDGIKKSSIPIQEVYYYNIPYRNPQLVSIHSINIAKPMIIDSKTVAVEWSQNIYVSKNNIYITYTETINEYEIMQDIMKELLDSYITSADRELIKKIKETDSDILTEDEKESKIMSIYMSYFNYLSQEEQSELEDKAEDMLEKELSKYNYLEFTVINKIGIDKGKITVGNNGRVPGHIINQFSLDEKDGVLRIATTVSQRWHPYKKQMSESTNNVYALNGNMRIVGKLEGLAKGERIYSTRFIGDKLYMVTFKQVDPFFVIDLSNPRNIKELGKLKIAGFSRYLHPYDENTLIGIGHDTTARGRIKGLKISLFDISDFEHPKEIARFVTDERYAQSTALYEHKAFLFSKEKELMVIPAYSYDYRSRKGYNGAFVFRVTRNKIELRGLIDHSMSEKNFYGPAVERSLWIEDLLYTKSQGLLRINKIDDLSSVKNITLISNSYNIPVY